MTVLGWLAKLFGYAVSPAGEKVISEVAREAKQYMQQLQDGTRPMPLPSTAVRHQQAQAALSARRFPLPPAVHPPTCPPSAPPSEMPPPAWHQATVTVDRAPPPTPRPLPIGHRGSGPPPRLSPPPPLPIPPRRALPLQASLPQPPEPVFPRPPRPSRPARKR